MEQERTIGHVEQVPPGEGRNFDIDGAVITVFRTRTEGLFATEPRCPHNYGILRFDLSSKVVATVKPAAMLSNCPHPARMVLGPGGL
jgi:nitrite reductase/ring-hydroxylating ferredoxin subunit